MSQSLKDVFDHKVERPRSVPYYTGMSDTVLMNRYRKLQVKLRRMASLERDMRNTCIELGKRFSR